jgi:uncharacterized protein (DUF488 family)
MAISNPLFTIGHSTRPIEAFLGLLLPNGITRVLDIRTVPRSRTNPQYNADVLPGLLAPRGIAHEHVAALGGLRPRNAAVPPEANGFWDNQGFHNYADYAMTSPQFAEGLAHLADIASRERAAIMCAEAVWWRCHRRIVTDYLLASGLEVFHILEGDVPEPARITPQARPTDAGRLAYPAAQRELGL